MNVSFIARDPDPAILILAPEVVRDTYGVPALSRSGVGKSAHGGLFDAPPPKGGTPYFPK